MKRINSIALQSNFLKEELNFYAALTSKNK